MYRESPVPASLRSRVACVWTLGPSSAPRRILPDGSADLVRVNGRLCVWGPSMTARVAESCREETVGLRLQPGAIWSLFRIAPEALQGRSVPLAELRRGWVDDAMTPENVLHWLTPIRDDVSTDLAVMRAVARLRQQPVQRTCTLAAELGLSERQLRRRFGQATGFSPKQLARLLRFERVADALRRRPGLPDWADLALLHGYADQAHLSREVRAFAGMSPSALAQELR